MLKRPCHSAGGCQFNEPGKVAMKIFIFTLALAASLVGCAMDGSTAAMGAGASGVATQQQVGMCQVFRSYASRGEGQLLQESCTRQLGADLCTRCLASGL
jgi:hypothetical protein